MDITLTPDQEKALDAFMSFLLDPNEPIFVLSGFSGTGKSTLVKVILEKYKKVLKLGSIITETIKEIPFKLTATTNKAAEALHFATHHEVSTIHSFLGLRVQQDFRANTTKLVPKKGIGMITDTLLFVDEASYIDKDLLEWIGRLTKNCKIVFMGDPAQLTPVKSSNTPVFDLKVPGAKLTQVVRQAEGNPIIDLSTKFRETVESNKFFSFKPDGHHIIRLDRDEFNQRLIQEFENPNWTFHDSKFLAWTNKRVLDYNQMINNHVKGDPHFQPGDYAICNSFVNVDGGSIKTDQMVFIDKMEREEILGVQGYLYNLDGHYTVFGPNSHKEHKDLINRLRAEENYNDLQIVSNKWIDLRAAYACTVNKAQGSTYKRVFIDLDDISKCNSGDQIARMMYVAVSRAKEQVFLTGDFK